MKSEQISEALNHLPEDWVAETLSTRGNRKKKSKHRLLWMGAAACLVLVTGLLLWGGEGQEHPEIRDSEQYLANTIVSEEPIPTESMEGSIAYAPTTNEDWPILYAPTENTDGGALMEDAEDAFVIPTPSRHLLFSPQYPKMTPYPTGDNTRDAELQWMEDKEKFYEPVKDFKIPEGFMDFYRNTARTFLAERKGENATYSPLNLYLALSMLAEITDGSTRQEILTLLGTGTIEEVRDNTAAFWLSNYCDDGILTCKLGNSIWLRDDMSYREETLATLAEIYYTASYSGTMGSEEYTQELRNWINEHTGGLLQDQVEGVSLDERMVVALVSTLHFKASWVDRFIPQNTESREFHGQNETVTMDFLHSVRNDTVYFGDNFTACKIPMSDGTAMWFFLPDEGITPQTLLEQDAIYNLSTYGRGTYGRGVELSLYLPKFDITAETDLLQGLGELGITEIFSPMESDFSPLTEATRGIFFSKAEHCARVKIDEEGCEAAAYTILYMYGAGLPEKLDRVELVFDRPFIFVITGRTDHPLFTGIVDQP